MAAARVQAVRKLRNTDPRLDAWQEEHSTLALQHHLLLRAFDWRIACRAGPT